MSETKNVVIEENKMGVMPVGKLLINMSVPMMCSMLVQALYNIVDSIFVSQICEDALTAVSMAFPLQSILIALGAGMGVGVNALVSRALGEKNYDKASRVAEHGVFLSICTYLVFLVIGLTCVTPFYKGQTDNPVIIGYGVQYLTIVSCVSFGIFGQFIFERLLQSTGRTFQTMITQMVGAIINLILDPILIFGLFGMPRMEVAGAAVATVAGQIVAATAAFIFNNKYNVELKLKAKGFKVDAGIVKDIYAIGVPSIIMQSIGSVMVYGLNKILIGFSSTAVAVFGVYFKLQSFVFMPIFGMNNGMIPIMAYNYGAKKRKRMMSAYKWAMLLAVAIMTVGAIVFELVPNLLLAMFNASDYMMDMGIKALRIIAIHFPIAACCIVTGSVFQSLGKAVYSMINSIMRQLVVLLPVAYFLALSGDVNNVWWAFPIAEIMSAIVTFIFFIKLYKDIISKVPVE